jgi:hypothetical protein
LIIVPRRTERLEGSPLASLLEQTPHPRLAASELISDFDRRLTLVVRPRDRDPIIHRERHAVYLLSIDEA